MLTTEWDFNTLYKGYDSDSYNNDVKKLEEIRCLEKTIVDTLEEGVYDASKILKYLELYEQLFSTERLITNYIYMHLSLDATHKKAQEALYTIQNEKVLFNVVENKFYQYISSIQKEHQSLVNDPLLSKYTFILQKIFRKAQYSGTIEQEKVITQMRRTGSTAFEELYNLTISTAKTTFELEGREVEYTLPQLRSLSQSSNAVHRAVGYNVEMKFFDELGDTIASCLSNIKGEVITVSKLRGYESPLDEVLLKSTMTKETFQQLLQTIKNLLPKFHEYLEAKAQYLGYEKGIPYYELFASVGTSSETISLEQSYEILERYFRTFDDSFADLFQTAFQSGWVDVYPKKGKTSGAFCQNIPMKKMSRILLNYMEHPMDTLTLAHEFGHAYHGFCLEDEHGLYQSYSMSLAETASTFAESIYMSERMREATEEERFLLRDNALISYVQVIVDIYSRFLFEEKVFEARKYQSLTKDDLCQYMCAAQKESYGESLAKEGHPYMWLSKPHYYEASLNYYNFPYAFGFLLSKGLYAQYKSEGASFVPKYREFLRKSGQMSIKDSVALMHIDIEHRDFWECIENDLILEIDEGIANLKRYSKGK